MRKRNYDITVITVMIISVGLLLSTSCKKATLPAVTTATIYGIRQTEAYSGGQVTSDGNGTVISRGVCWSTTANPTIKDSKTADSSGLGSFTSHITGLSATTIYHARAYATNETGTAYGSDATFTTTDKAIPTVTTGSVKSLTLTTASGIGNVTSDGGDPVTARGLCWNTTGGARISDNHTDDGTGTGLFYSSLTDLVVGTTYYITAYAINSLGTGYGEEITYTHTEPVTDMDGNAYSVITIGTQVWMGENLKTTSFNDGSAIPDLIGGLDWSSATTPGYCWYNNSATVYKEPYGALYNWYAVNTGKLCPLGWHVPSSDEYATLIDYLGGLSVAGELMKEYGTAHWLTPNTGASNGSGFTALPGGGRYNLYSEAGAFSDLGMYGYHWSASQGTDTSTGVSYDLGYDLISVVQDQYPKGDGGSVRCLKDAKK